MKLLTLFYKYVVNLEFKNFNIGNPHCALVMVCRIIHKFNNHYSTMKICETAPGKLSNV